jgi:hypothetical protein
MPSTSSVKCDADDATIPVGGTLVVTGSVTVKNDVTVEEFVPDDGSLKRVLPLALKAGKYL